MLHKKTNQTARQPSKINIYMKCHYKECLIIISLILTTFLVHWQLKNHDFIYLDDHIYVTENKNIQSGLTRENIARAFTTTRAGFWIPLVWISYMIDHEIYGMDPGGYHLTNLLLHIANAILLFLFLRWVTGFLYQSAFVAFVFAMHPLHVESVAWITERKDVLCAFFWMLTLLAYAYYLNRAGVRRYLLIVFFFVLGLMAKPMLVTLPFVLLLLDYWPLKRLKLSIINGPGPSKVLWKIVYEKIPLFVLSLVFSAIAYFTQQNIGAIRSLENRSFGLRITNAIISYTKYLWKTIWPVDLVVFYPFPEETLMWQVVGSGALLVFISVLVIFAARRYSYIPVGWFWFIGTLLPVIGLVQAGAQAMADSFMYIPLIGLSMIVAWGIPDLLVKFHYKKTLLSLAAGALSIFLIVGTWSQLGHWKNSISLFEHTLQRTNNNFLAHNYLGNYLLKQEKIEEAVTQYSEALRINPYFYEG